MAEIKIVRVAGFEARAYPAKAREFVKAAEASLEASQFDAAMLNAVHAAIASADAVTAGLGGVRSADPDHGRVVALLAKVLREAGVTATPPSQIERLIAKKNLVAYETRRATGREALEAVERAKRVLAWAEAILTPAGG